MTQVVPDIVPLNRSEHGYAAIEGLAATMIQPYVLRLTGPVAEPLVRQTLRALVTIYPRLRAVLEPGPHRYHFRILPDDELVDQLFDLAYQVDTHVDPENPRALEAWHNRLINEVVPLERGLGMRARFIPHPRHPVIVLGMHHILGDGMTMVQLLRQIMLGINGRPLEPMPLEAPSMMGSIAPEHWWQWPAKMWRARQHKVAESQLLASVNVQQVPTRTGPHYSTSVNRHHEVQVGTEVMRKAARKLGVSLNTFLVSGLAQTFLDQAPHDPKAAAVIRISVNLRRYYPKEEGHGPLWGNHVGAFLIVEQDAGKALQERVRSVDASIKEGQDRYARREMCWTYVMEEILPWLGRTLIGHLALKMKRADRFPRISGHSTSLGDASVVNPPDATVRADRLFAAVTSIAPLIAFIELEGRLYVPVIWQLAETSVSDMDVFLARVDQTLARMVRQAGL